MLDLKQLADQVAEVFSEKLHIDVPSHDSDLIEIGAIDSLQLFELLFSWNSSSACAFPWKRLILLPQHRPDRTDVGQREGSLGRRGVRFTNTPNSAFTIE